MCYKLVRTVSLANKMHDTINRVCVIKVHQTTQNVRPDNTDPLGVLLVPGDILSFVVDFESKLSFGRSVMNNRQLLIWGNVIQ